MRDYIHLFQTNAQYESARANNYIEPWVGYTRESSGISYNKTEYEKLFETPLTFNIISAGTIVWKTTDGGYATTIEYSTDNGSNWSSITSNTGDSAPSINVNAGDKIQFRGDNVTYNSGGSRYNMFSGSTAKFSVEGNIMSLIDSTGFATAATLTSANTFNYLFSYCTGLTSAENLILPATTLAQSCYQRMFQGCTSLTTAPALPATTLATYCYGNMFNGCTSLTTAPKLPATTLALGCYKNMFYNCTSLTTAPELPVTTLGNQCYYGMFYGCTSLTTAPELPATSLANECYREMFYGCTSLTTAPELPATILVNSCYGFMFYDCSRLNYIKCLATDISADSCINGWVYGVASTGTFVKNPLMNSWTTVSHGIPENWAVQNAS